MAESAWPFVGREPELEAIAVARRERGGMVVRAGAGVGKSRLAREAHAVAARDGAHTEWVQATRSAAAVPLGAAASLIPGAVGTDDPVQLMHRVTDDLRARAGHRQVVLGVDDAQLLDPASAALILHLATTGTAFVLATVRAGAPAPDAVDALWKDGPAGRLDLRPLDLAGVRALVEGALGDPVEETALRWATGISQGNALYVRELVTSAVDTGALVHENGFWRLEGTPAAAPSLIEQIDGRVAELDPNVREAVEFLALGEPLRLDELDEAALLAAEERGLVAARGVDVGLAHPLYGEAVRAALPPLRARRLRLRLAEMLLARDPLGPSEVLRVARLRLDAGAELDDDLRLTAARAANVAGDPDLAADLAGPRAGEDLSAALVLAHAHALRNRYAEAEAVLAAVEPLAAGHAERSDYLKRRVSVQYFGLRRSPADLLGRAAGWDGGERHSRLLVRLRAGHGGDALDFDIDPSVPDASRRAIRALRALNAFLGGDCLSAAADVLAACPPVPLRDEGDEALLAVLAYIGVDACGGSPELDAALTTTLSEALGAGDHGAAGCAAFGLARIALLRGRYRDAARWVAEADVHLRAHDTYAVVLPLRASAVGIAAATNDYDAAVAALGRLREAAEARPPMDHQRPHLIRAEAWVARFRDDAEAARMLLAAAGEFAAMPGVAAPLTYEAFRAGAAIETFPTTDSRLFAAQAQHVAAADGASLLDAAERFASIAADGYAVEAATAAAATFVAEARPDSARRAAARARELHHAEGAPLPRIDGLDGIAIELTRREAQLVDLARQGLSNAEIADRLVISIRTVETHLYRGMTKLGINDRRALRST